MTREDERLMAAEKTFPMDIEVMSVEEQADMILRQMCFNIGAKWSDENPDGKMLLHVLNKGVEQGKREVLNNLWKSADGNDLPEIDKEVIVFTQDFPNDAGIMKVAIAHRPNPNGWDGKNIATGEIEHYTPKTYDKGGWNIPNVVIWLDLELPKMED